MWLKDGPLNTACNEKVFLVPVFIARLHSYIIIDLSWNNQRCKSKKKKKIHSVAHSHLTVKRSFLEVLNNLFFFLQKSCYILNDLNFMCLIVPQFKKKSVSYLVILFMSLYFFYFGRSMVLTRVKLQEENLYAWLL